ncbi:MAG: sulfatase-like hydrolase/transferase [Bacteroidales bacterium]|nr:sulfatase-like hydrolase/transferase [Bacteroidales bacterium]
MNKTIKTAAGALLPLLAGCSSQEAPHNLPNILLIVADDLGIGDVSCYGMGRINTPNLDSLASLGVRFTNAYATSATSTPSRYALFTGLYPWTNPDARILPGDAPLIIPTDIPTLPKMLQEAGYRTSAIGKWHLGMGNGNPDWNAPISPCANDIGFDYSCLIAATNDRVPTVYVENGRVLGLEEDDPLFVSYEHNFEGEPTALSNPEMLRLGWHHGHNCSIVNGVPRIGYMKGGRNAIWNDEDMADYFCCLVKGEIDRQKNSGRPFFIYYGLHEPHVPRLPHQRFQGATGYGTRGDAIVEADWCVGEVLRHLDKEGLLDNTLVVFTSDNGPVLQDGYLDGAEDLVADHTPAGIYRGGKYSLFDGGTHIPLIVYWKGHTRAGVSRAFVSQLDFYASAARLAGQEVPEGLDSKDLSKAFLGRDAKGRDELILEAKSRLALKQGDYVLIPPYKGAKVRKTTGTELGNFESWSLFNLSEDPHQEHDLSIEEPQRLQQMKDEFFRLAGSHYDYDITALMNQK